MPNQALHLILRIIIFHFCKVLGNTKHCGCFCNIFLKEIIFIINPLKATMSLLILSPISFEIYHFYRKIILQANNNSSDVYGIASSNAFSKPPSV